MTDDTILDAATSSGPFNPLGEVLAEARAAKKLSQQDVSNHLRFSVKQVDALENNQFDALPDAMITRGFIRNYARYLDVDAEPLLESYKARRPSKTPGPVSVQSTSYSVMSGKDSQPWLKYILGSILILLFLLGWIFYIDYLPKTSSSNAMKAPEIVAPNATTEVPLPEIALPAAERQADSDASSLTAPEATPDANSTLVDPNAVPNPGASIPPTVNSNGPIALPSATETSNSTTVNQGAAVLNPTAQPTNPASSPISPQPPAAAKPITANPVALNSTANPPATMNAGVKPGTVANNASGSALSLSVTEKTWINVKDNSGKVVYEKTLPPGGVDTVKGEAPFNVIVGNAKATSIMYKGQPVNLAASATENNVARIKLE